MYILEHPQRPLLLEPPDYAGYGYLSDRPYHEAMGIVKSSENWDVRLGRVMTCLARLPYAQNLSQFDALSATVRFDGANMLKPSVYGYIVEESDKMCRREDFRIDDMINYFEDVLRSETIPSALYVSKREFQIAVTEYAIWYFALEYLESNDSGNREVLYSNHQAMSYFIALHDLMVGVKTNFTAFLLHPTEKNLNRLARERVLTVSGVPEETTAREIFSGETVFKFVDFAIIE